jgi:hypothetical protein
LRLLVTAPRYSGDLILRDHGSPISGSGVGVGCWNYG